LAWLEGRGSTLSILFCKTFWNFDFQNVFFQFLVSLTFPFCQLSLGWWNFFFLLFLDIDFLKTLQFMNHF
jgi:hypothetical protein